MSTTTTRPTSPTTTYRDDLGGGGGGLGGGNRRTGGGGGGNGDSFDHSFGDFAGTTQMSEREFAMAMERTARHERGMTATIAQERLRGIQHDLQAEKHRTSAKQLKMQAAAKEVTIARERLRQQDAKLQLQQAKTREIQVDTGIVRDKVGAMIVERQMMQALHAANLSALNLDLGERLGENALRSDVLTYKGLLGGSGTPFEPRTASAYDFDFTNDWRPRF